jgi:anti-sigma factor RsiW
MTCRGIRSRMSAYIDGDLRPEEAGRVAGHLETCAACGQGCVAAPDHGGPR